MAQFMKISMELRTIITVVERILRLTTNLVMEIRSINSMKADYITTITIIIVTVIANCMGRVMCIRIMAIEGVGFIRREFSNKSHRISMKKAD